MIYAKQSTAIIVTVGPVMDASGVAVTDGVVGDFKASKNGGAPAALNGSATLTHRNTGHYSLSLTTTDTNTVGTLEIVIDDTVNACPIKEITVLTAAVYDALFGSSAPGYVANAPVNVAQFGGTNGTFASGRPEVNVSHIGGSTTPVTNMTTVYSTDFASNYNTALDQWAVNVSRIDGSAASGQIRTAVGLASANLDTQLGAIDTTADSILATLGTPVDTSISQDIANTRGVVDTIQTDTDDLQTQIGAAGAGLTAVPWNAAWDAEVQSEVQDAIEANHLDHLLAVTYDPAAKPGAADALLNELIGNDAGVSQFTANALELAPTGGSAPTVAQIVAGVWDEPTAGNTTSGTFGAAVVAAGSAGDPWSTSLPGAYGSGTAGFIVDQILDRVLLALPAVAAGANGGLPLGDAAGDVTVGGFTAAALAQFVTTDTSQDHTLVVAGSVLDVLLDSMILRDSEWLVSDINAGSVMWIGAHRVWENAKADHVTANTYGDYLDAKVSSRSSHSAADVVTALGTGSGLTALATAAAVADLPTNAELTTALDALPTAAEVATSVFTTAMTEAYRSAGATATLAQFAYEVLAHLGESSIAGTTKTLKRLDGTTTAKTYTLDDASTPTSITEAT